MSLRLGVATPASQIRTSQVATGISYTAPVGSPDLIVVLGATATGKSALSLRLAEALDGELINADALQVYRGLDIGTAKPSAEDRRRVPHHLLDLLPPAETFSAGEFARSARAAIAEVRLRRRRPIVVGGSGFYLRALLGGIGPLPAGDSEVRSALRQRLAIEGLMVLRRELALVDPVSAARIAASDTQRNLRALEVFQTTGEPLSAWQARAAARAEPLPALRVGLTVPRALLYDRIAQRVQGMVAAGWNEEVRGLLASGVPATAPAFQAIGYRQMVDHLSGRLSLDAAVAETIRATRRYAKRQETWFRNEPDVTWFSAEHSGETVDRVLWFLQRSGAERR